MKRVLLIGPCPKDDASGVSMSFHILVDGFKRKGCRFMLVDLLRGGFVENCGRFALKRAWNSILIVLAAWLRLPFAATVYMIISSSKLGFLRDSLIIWAARIMGKRIVLHLRGGGYREFYYGQSPTGRKVIRVTLAGATHIVVLGELLRDQFDFIPRSDEVIRVVLNGLPKDLSPQNTTPKTLPKAGDKLRLLYLSNLIPSKGYLDLLEACDQLKNSGSLEFTCDFCGAFAKTAADEYEAGLEEQKADFFHRISTSELDAEATYHGTILGQDKENMLSKAHILILPTYYPWEGQPVCIIEALAFGTPVIGTKHRGIPEEVIDGYNGYLVSPKNPSELADAIRRVAADPARYTQMSANARKHFEKHFTREAHLRNLMKLICPDAETTPAQT